MVHFGHALALPYFTGTVTVATDSPWDVGLAGHQYQIDWDAQDGFRRESVPLLRDQADQGQRPGEQSINPNGLWRRSVESWHHGAGQSWLDHTDTDPFRYNASKGVDPWDRYGLTLLPDTEVADAAATSNLYLAVSGGRLYASGGQGIRVTGAGDETFADATGLAAVDISALTSDGATCYAAQGASGIYKATAAAFTSFVTGTVALVRYVNGRLIATQGGAVYNPIAAGALPTALFTHPSASWTWTDATDGQGHIYLSGYAGDKSAVYRTAVMPDGTGLDIPVVAAVLPDGELAKSLTGYLGYVVVGTTLGVRFAVRDANGDLTLGALIPTSSAVLCGEGQDRFVWFGNSAYDATSTGLGRLDLTSFTGDLTPAYASDLMATGSGTVVSVATYRDKRWFTVAAAGTYRQKATKVASGTLTGGRVAYGLPDNKTALYVSVRHDALAASQSVAVTLYADAATLGSGGLSSTVGTTEPAEPFALTNVDGHDFEWTITLTGDVALRAVFMLADPQAESRSEYIWLPILLDDVVSIGGVQQPVDVAGEQAFLTSLRDTRRVVTYQEGTSSVRVIVEDTRFVPRDHRTADRRAYQGTYYCKLKGV